jgi:hypothetical protein
LREWEKVGYEMSGVVGVSGERRVERNEVYEGRSKVNAAPCDDGE